VPYQWRRIAQVTLIAALVTLPGELLLPDDGFAGLVMRIGAWALFPVLLWVTRFPTEGERQTLEQELRPSALRARWTRMRAPAPEPAPAGGPAVPESIEVEIRDEDRF
jgi:hypothetical protein